MLLALMLNSFFPSILGQGPDSVYVKEIVQFQAEINSKFTNKRTSPFCNKDRKRFKSLEYYPINKRYRVKAKLARHPNEDFFRMKTSTGNRSIYRKYGEVNFEIDEKSFVLSIYQSLSAIESTEQKNDLFLLFKDDTNGNETYEGGRYLDLIIPEGDMIILDFNKAYNPLCHYNSAYSCPIPPKENYLGLEIKAGVKRYQKN